MKLKKYIYEGRCLNFLHNVFELMFCNPFLSKNILERDIVYHFE